MPQKLPMTSPQRRAALARAATNSTIRSRGRVNASTKGCSRESSDVMAFKDFGAVLPGASTKGCSRESSDGLG